MDASSVVDLSRWQFAVTVLYHFIFVPLTIGLILILGIMETVYVLSGKEIWKSMTKFWGMLFGINFAMGVATGIVMEFEFGTNWAHYTQFVGDIFGSPLAIEGLMAFFLEATFVGLFFFGWERLSKGQHLMVTWLVFVGSNFSALWILIANGWMQHPVGAYFNPLTLRMELKSFYDVLFNLVGQVSFLHTVAAAYTYGSMFVIGISAFYLLTKRYHEFAKRSIIIAATTGLMGICLSIFIGDENGYLVWKDQPTKMAVMEGMWKTEPAPASFSLLGWPDNKSMTNLGEIRIPYLIGLLGTRSLTNKIIGIKDLKAQSIEKFKRGVIAYSYLQKAIHHQYSKEVTTYLNQHLTDLGYGLLLSQYVNPAKATQADFQNASSDIYPNHVWLVYWSFRLMVGIGFILFFVFLIWFILVLKRKFYPNSTWLKVFMFISILCIPLPVLASEFGWIVQEYGRQPWAVYEILPTAAAASILSFSKIVTSLIIFIVLYTSLFIVDAYLMFVYAKRGPEAFLKHLPEKLRK